MPAFMVHPRINLAPLVGSLLGSDARREHDELIAAETRRRI